MEYKDCFLREQESQAISLILSDNDQLDVMGLSLDDFGDEAHRLIFEGITELWSEGRSVDVISLSSVIDVSKVPISQLAKAASAYVPGSNASLIALRLKEASVARKIIKSLSRLKSPKEIGQLLKICEESGPSLNTSKAMNGKEFLAGYMAHYEARIKIREEGGSLGLMTGFYTLDENLPMKPGDLITLAARTSIGKSALSLSIATSAAMFKQNVLFCSAEMSWESLGDRLFAILSGGNVSDLENAADQAAYQRSLMEFEQMKNHFHLQYVPRMTSRDVVASAKKISSNTKLDLIVVDYLQYLADPKERGSTDVQRIGAITQRFKQLAGELNCVVLLLSQVNRQAANNENGMPRLENLRDSGCIEQDSDAVLLLNREHRSSEAADLLIAKARRGKAGGVIRLHYKPETTRFKDISERKHSVITAQAAFASMLD